MRLRWKLEDRETGLRTIFAGPRGSYLHDGTETFASIQACGRFSDRAGWFWCARNDSNGIPLFNSCETPVKTADEAKAQAMAYVKKHLEQRTAAKKATND